MGMKIVVSPFHSLFSFFNRYLDCLIFKFSIMKKVLLLMTLGLFTSCSNELLDNSTALSNSSGSKSMILTSSTGPETKTVRDIKNYISRIKFGNITGRSVFASSYDLSPFIYKGDTIMYVVNYASGWELLSTDHRIPLVMMSSESGSFHLSDTLTMAPAFRNYLNDVSEELYQIKQLNSSDGETYGLWKAVSIQNDEVDAQLIEVAPRAQGTQPGNGYWVLLNTTSPVTTTITSNKLTSTQWGQGSPWNNYVPYVSSGSSTHCVAGCMGVACAQYLYYLHYKNNKPTNTVTSATYQSSSNTYNYSGSSSSVWNQMAKTSSGSGTNYSAIFIGYVGKNINTIYGANSSSAYFTDIISFINQEGSFNYESVTFDYSYVTNELIAGRAVLAYAQSPKENPNEYDGHAFIIDRYKKNTTSSTSTFGWVGTDNLGQDSNEYDENGNIVGYSFFYERENETNSYAYGMNWGWDGSYDNTFCVASSGADWNVGYHFNFYRLIAK